MSTIIPPSLNFKTVEKASPSYSYLKIPINSIPGALFPLSFTSQTVVDFKLPNKVINLGRSYLGYINTYLTEGGGFTPWIPEDTTDLGIGNVSLISSQGTDVLNLNYVTNFIKIAAKLGTSKIDLLNNGPIGDGLYLNSQTNVSLLNYYPAPYTLAAGNPYNFAAGSSNIAINGSAEVQYLSNSLALGATMVKYRQFPLSFFKDTILSLDKDLYFGPQADMFLRFMVGGSKCGWDSNLLTDPTATAVALKATNSNITDMYLYLCIENNQEVINTIMDTYNSGKLIVQIPYTVGVKTFTPSSTVNNVVINITKNNGKYLKKIVHTLFNGSEIANLAFDMSNWNGTKALTYNTLLDQNQLQQQLVSCAQPLAGSLNLNDYALNKRISRNSAINGMGQYANNWFHCDTFFDDAHAERTDGNNIREGILMTDNHLWTFASSTASAVALNNYTFITYTKDMFISSNGIQFV
jgi:hypothetical protein